MHKATKHFYEFGPFRLDPVEGLLLRDGQAVALTPKAFDTLRVLIESSGHVLGKDELMSRVWPDSYVEETNLAQHISALRKVLGEREQGGQYIETVPKRGYRFVAQVREWRDEGADLIVREHTKARVVIVPALVLHRTGDLCLKVEEGRYVAERIPGSKFVELPGVDHLPFVGDQDAILDEVEEFLTGVRHAPEHDRVLATVLFTQFAGSTARAAELGDERWRETLERHHAHARREIELYRGREIEMFDDGFLATFDGPARAIRAACAISDYARRLGIEIKAGLHTGECDVVGDKMSGLGVEIGAQVAANAAAGEVLVSSTVKALVAGSGIRFEDRNAHVLEGVPGDWRLFAVER